MGHRMSPSDNLYYGLMMEPPRDPFVKEDERKPTKSSQRVKKTEDDEEDINKYLGRKLRDWMLEDGESSTTSYYTGRPFQKGSIDTLAIGEILQRPQKKFDRAMRRLPYSSKDLAEMDERLAGRHQMSAASPFQPGVGQDNPYAGMSERDRDEMGVSSEDLLKLPQEPRLKPWKQLTVGEREELLAQERTDDGLNPNPVMEATQRAIDQGQTDVEKIAKSLETENLDQVKKNIPQPEELEDAELKALRNQLDKWRNRDVSGFKGMDLTPMLSLVDAWTGSNFARSYNKPLNEEEKQMMIDKLETRLAVTKERKSTQKALAKKQNDQFEQRLKQQLDIAKMRERGANNRASMAESTRIANAIIRANAKGEGMDWTDTTKLMESTIGNLGAKISASFDADEKYGDARAAADGVRLGVMAAAQEFELNPGTDALLMKAALDKLDEWYETAGKGDSMAGVQEKLMKTLESMGARRRGDSTMQDDRGI